MESRARIAGYTAVAALLILAAWMGNAVIHELLHPNRIVQVRFSQLGTLKIQDPVVENGVPIGEIKSLRLQDGLPFAEIELFDRSFIPSDSRFVDFNHSLMGARMVVLRPGRSSVPMDENRIQEGFFADGIAERIHRINKLLGQVIHLRAQTDRLFVGPDAPLSPELFARLEEDSEKLSHLANQVDQAGNSLQSGLQSWSRMGNGLRGDVKSASGIDTTEKSLALTLKVALSAEQNADALLTSAERLLTAVQDSNGKINSLLYSRTAFDQLQGSVEVLQGALNALQNKGLTKAVQWRNVHFFKSKTE